MRAAGIRVCCGGIVGMGESRADRAGLLGRLDSTIAAAPLAGSAAPLAG